MIRRETSQLFDLVFKTLMRLSDRAIVSFINGLFGTSHPLSSAVSRPSAETVSPALRRSMADMVITINNSFSYIIEAQISNDRSMGVRILQYILGEGQETVSTGRHVTRIRLPDARVIYWETTRGTPDRETIIFEFPDGGQYRMEVPSFKFPAYSPARLEELDLAILLPLCMLGLRREIRAAAKRGKDRQEMGERLAELVAELREAAERSEEREIISRGDLLNVDHLINRLCKDLYGEYTELVREKTMWEDIEIIDYDGMLAEAEKEMELRLTQELTQKITWEITQKLTRELTQQVTREITQKLTRELTQKVTQELTQNLAQEFDQKLRQAEERVIQKLRETGVSEDQFAAAGLNLSP
ncbi:MAG: hypothetical protein LBO76_07080 [Treponema sp.]|nr:hypothetical protein [Treponema sp.]